MTNIRHSFLAFVGDIATRYPSQWIYSFLVVGMALGIAICAYLGLAIGNLMHAPTTGMYCGLGWYGYNFARNIDAYNAICDQWISQLKEARSHF